ncbi:MAG: 4-alpha-glucanotransferase [Bacteroidetes bacterium]|jgi:4-alpha-glucanotransferase|nr:4-alpha-glucanotransferase [Bacteroidota bacterium]
MDFPRTSGLLLHITSLPSAYGIGDFGSQAYAFADFLASAHQRLWQVLPMVPVGFGNSPYASPCTFAGNPLLISPDVLIEDGLLHPDDLGEVPSFDDDHVDFERAAAFKRGVLERAYDRFERESDGQTRRAFENYVAQQRDWLVTYALFKALKEAHGEAAWMDWPTPLAQRQPEALAQARRDHARTIRMHMFWQYLFDDQWDRLRSYCHRQGIRIFGDLPIYVAQDSADVWAQPELFYLDETGHPTVVSGVPPDYFSETGQRWGNPLYRWDVMQENDFAWWTRRLERILSRIDIVRLDHFRAFEAYWEIPEHEETAINGRWVPGPGAALFETVRDRLGGLPIVAEDLGVITDDVRQLMQQFGFPGMAVLQFAFNSGTNSGFLPHNYQHNLVAYTGTHDNDTIQGWWHNTNGSITTESMERTREYARLYLDLDEEREHELHWTCLRTLMASSAGMVVTPIQDLLGLGSEARMNTPGASNGNWGWRLCPDALDEATEQRLRALTRAYGRSEDTSLPI